MQKQLGKRGSPVVERSATKDGDGEVSGLNPTLGKFFKASIKVMLMMFQVRVRKAKFGPINFVARYYSKELPKFSK